MKVGNKVIVRSEQERYEPTDGVIIRIVELGWDTHHSKIGFPYIVETDNGQRFYREDELEVKGDK